MTAAAHTYDDSCPDCDHVWGIHHRGRCYGWMRLAYPKLWLPLGYRVQLLRRCRCRSVVKPEAQRTAAAHTTAGATTLDVREDR